MVYRVRESHRILKFNLYYVIELYGTLFGAEGLIIFDRIKDELQ